MPNSKTISKIVLDACSNYPYVAFKYNKKPIEAYDMNGTSILISKSNVNDVVQQLSAADYIYRIRLHENKANTKLEIKTIDDNDIKIEFIHEFFEKALRYLDKKEIFEARVRDEDGIFVPIQSQLLTYALLRNFLNNQGITEEQFDYFDSLDFRKKVDLIGSFNEQYNTNFPSVYLLSCFDEDEKKEMVRAIKSLPDNRLINQVNVKVHNFFGQLKQARVI